MLYFLNLFVWDPFKIQQFETNPVFITGDTSQSDNYDITLAVERGVANW
jgi:hypothetical protein